MPLDERSVRYSKAQTLQQRILKFQATRPVTEQGYSLRDAAERLGVSAWSIRYWIKTLQQTAELTAQNQTQPVAD